MKYIIQNYQDNVYKYYVVSNQHNFLKHCSMRIFIWIEFNIFYFLGKWCKRSEIDLVGALAIIWKDNYNNQTSTSIYDYVNTSSSRIKMR